MSWVTGPQVAAHYRHQAEVLYQVYGTYQGLVAELKEADAKVTEQRTKARVELAALYLNELSTAAFERVAKLTGFQGFARRDPRQALEHERHVLQQSLAKLESDPQYANRDMVARQLADEIANAKDTLAPLEAECQKFEAQLGFKELVDIGYDTPRFGVKWWHASYWKYWATGDKICKALDMSDFGDDVLPAYNKAAEPRNFMLTEVKKFEAQLDALHELVREHDRITNRLANLESIYLAEAQAYLGEHLEHADSALLEQWVGAEPAMQRAVQMGLRKIAGLSAKKRFINEIEHTVTNTLLPQLSERQQKAKAKSFKFARPKYEYNRVPGDLINEQFDAKMTGLTTQREKVGGRVQKLVAAENYAGFDLRNDEEMWWLFLMQSPPPRLAPTLFDYYQRRPDAQPITDPDYADLGPTPGEAAAMAYAAGELEPGGAYLS